MTTQGTRFCPEAPEEAMAAYGKPLFFNAGRGRQFASAQWSGALKEAGIQVSMDGKGCRMVNAFIECLWRFLKYECVYLNAFDSVREAQDGA